MPRPLEQKWLRTFVPFYGWYRAITQVTLRLPLEAPGRANALNLLGQIGSQWEADHPVPSYLQGAVPVGPQQGDTQRILKTAGVNAFATPAQLGQGLLALFPGGTTGQRQQLAGTINPFLAGAGQALYGRGSPVGIAAGTVGDVGQGLPELQALQLLLSGPRPPTLYQPSPFDQWLGLAGVPLRTLNLPEAQSRAQQGR